MDILASLQPAEPLPKKQQQILDATVECVRRWGVDRFTINDVIKQAKVARSTIYVYYNSKEDIIRDALLQSAYQFAERLFNFMMQFPDPSQRFIEAMVYTLKRLPDEPSLALISHSGLHDMVSENILTTQEGLEIVSLLMQAILEEETLTAAELREISETVLRMMLSLLTLVSDSAKDETALRGYIARRLLPSIGLTTPSQYAEHFQKSAQ